MKQRPLVIAHRGASARAPENTAAAVDLAVALGADAIECDVQLSRDGVPVVFHDDELERLCGCAGRVGTRTVRELTRLRVRVAGRTGRPDRVLTLARWLARVPPHVLPVVELKRQASARTEERLVDGAVPLLRGRRGPVAVISFSRRMTARVARELPDALVGPVLDRAPKGRAWQSLARPLVALERRLATRAFVARLARAGRVAWCWTVDDPAEARELAARGVAGIISNRPDAVGARRRRSSSRTRR